MLVSASIQPYDTCVIMHMALRSKASVEPTFTMAERCFRRWATQHIFKPIDISMTMRTISGMVLDLILEHIMGDQTLEAKWDELPDFLTDMILDGLASDKS